MIDMTEDQKNDIDSMTHLNMCSMWRFAASGHPYFNNTNEASEYFKDRLFKHFGGFTPEISKQLS